MKRMTFALRLALGALALALLSISPSLFADGGANHQKRNQHFGVSGGNVNDITRAFCCSGTLGSLVKDSNNVQYILSNNHVLGRSDQAASGEDISQPGLIDNGCRVATVVADFTKASPLGSNVDAAIAQLRSGTMDSTGFIEDIGTISSNVKAPTPGLAVAKSGRTTGFTTGTIASINTSVSVQYQKNCGSGKKFVVSYTNQVVINSSTFSAGGDSGSLIVSNNSTSCRQPVALLFAGSSTTTIGNPIGEVITKLNAATGKALSFVGGNCTAAATQSLSHGPSDAAIEFATAAMRGREQDLMSRPGVMGVGISAGDNSQEAAIVVYIDSTAKVKTKLPKAISGVKVKRIYSEPFVAF